jgi:hypothetical protein
MEHMAKHEIRLCFINTLYAQAEENFIQYFSTTAFFMQPVS